MNDGSKRGAEFAATLTEEGIRGMRGRVLDVAVARALGWEKVQERETGICDACGKMGTEWGGQHYKWFSAMVVEPYSTSNSFIVEVMEASSKHGFCELTRTWEPLGDPVLWTSVIFGGKAKGSPIKAIGLSAAEAVCRVYLLARRAEGLAASPEPP